MQPILFALGIFVFVAINLLVLRYTTYLSNAKKVQLPASGEPVATGDQVTSR
ncbi:MAG: hypothetical protein IRZ10_07955 [Thermoflavifilum sp.]|nr:hypothetical protein [Thermoflavifilum sp.]MCL6514344.1 hypothetical protein [Alicyclobacillus sp.]